MSVSELTAEAIAAEHYGIVAHAKRLPGERDSNFALRGDGVSYLLKVIHPEESPQATDLCTTLLRELAGRPDLPVQRIVPTLAGKLTLRLELAPGRAQRARITTYLGGRTLRSVPSTPTLRAAHGRTLARLALALKPIRHPAGARPLLWDLWQAGHLRALLDELPGIPGRVQLTTILDQFESDLRSRLAKLRRQMVHNDLNSDNVLVAIDGETIVGIIDFGDAIVTQLVNDVASAATSHLSDDADPMAPVLDFVSGYNCVVRLEDAELELLYDLIRLRFGIQIIVSEWRARQFPNHTHFILRNTGRSRRLLEQLSATAGAAATERIMSAC